MEKLSNCNDCPTLICDQDDRRTDEIALFDPL